MNHRNLKKWDRRISDKIKEFSKENVDEIMKKVYQV